MYLPVGSINKKFLQVKVRKRRKTRSFTLFSRFFLPSRAACTVISCQNDRVKPHSQKLRR